MPDTTITADSIEQRFDDLALEALGSLKEAIRAGDGSKESLALARLAVGAISGWTRYRATQRARDATTFQVVRAIAGNPEELRAYIAATLPHLRLVQPSLPVSSADKSPRGLPPSPRE